jgi:hypothetical protein
MPDYETSGHARGVQEDVQMKDVVVGLGRGLSGNLSEAGNNLSVGQVCQPTAFVFTCSDSPLL